MSLSEIQEQLEIYFEMEKGAFIPAHLDLIDLVKDIFVTKRSLKHVVEQRKKDSYTTDKLKLLFSDIYNIVLNENYLLVPNKDNSFFIIENQPSKKTLAVGIIEIVDDKKIIATAFYRSFKKMKKHFSKK